MTFTYTEPADPISVEDVIAACNKCRPPTAHLKELIVGIALYVRIRGNYLDRAPIGMTPIGFIGVPLTISDKIPPDEWRPVYSLTVIQ